MSVPPISPQDPANQNDLDTTAPPQGNRSARQTLCDGLRRLIPIRLQTSEETSLIDRDVQPQKKTTTALKTQEKYKLKNEKTPLLKDPADIPYF